MHIQSSSRYLEMINFGLMNVLAPQIQDDQSKAVIGILQGALKELYKRESRTPELLIEGNQKGLDLASQLQAFASEINRSEDAVNTDLNTLQSLVKNADVQAFSKLRDINNRLNACLALLAKQLSGLRSGQLTELQKERMSRLIRQAADWDFDYSDAQREAIDFQAFDLGKPPEGSDVNQQNLQQFVDQQRPGEGIKVSALSKIPGGMGKHTYKCTFSRTDASSEDVIIRKQDVNPAFTRGAWSIDAEYLLIKTLADAGYNVPKPLMLAHDEKAFDADFFIMEKKQGIVPGNFFGPTIEIKEELLLDLAANMAKLHSIEIDRFSSYINKHLTSELLQADIKNAYRIELQSWFQYIEDYPLTASPAVVYSLDWLMENIPENTHKPVLVHGDFNIHNFLVEDNKITTVLDWEMALFGDPAQDIAYIKPNIEKYIDWEKFMQHYYYHGGRQIDVSTFGYYIAFANTRPLMGTLRNMSLFDRGKTNDVRMPIMDTEFLPQFIKNILEHSN